MNLMLNMTLDHKSPLNHGLIQQGESASTNCGNKDSQERSLFQEMLPKVPLIVTRKLKRRSNNKFLKYIFQLSMRRSSIPTIQASVQKKERMHSNLKMNAL